MMEMREGAIIDHYRVRGKLGQGGMGSVYKIQDMDTGEIHAMKIVSPEAADRFDTEARALAALRHPHVIRFHSIWPMPDGSFGLMMDFVVGKDLQTLWRDGLSPRQVVEYVHQAAMGLDYCHSKDVVHRDIKPANIMVADAGSSGVAMLVDFGLGKDRGAGQDATEYGMAAGTAPFMPPEQMHDFRNAGAAADQWSLAVTAWVLLTGDFPFPRAPYSFDGRRSIGSVAPELPSSLEAVFTRAFQLDPEQRYPSCVDLTRPMGAAFGMDLPMHAKDHARRKITERVVPVVPEVDWTLRESDDLWGFCAARLGNTVRTVAATRSEFVEALGPARLTVRVAHGLLLAELRGRDRNMPSATEGDPTVRALEDIGWRRRANRARPWSLAVPVDHNPDDAAKRILEALEVAYGLDADHVYRYL